MFGVAARGRWCEAGGLARRAVVYTARDTELPVERVSRRSVVFAVATQVGGEFQ